MVVVEALQARLKVLEDEIFRQTNLAAQASDTTRQDNYLRMAQDLQREARVLRLEILRMSEAVSTNAATNALIGFCSISSPPRHFTSPHDRDHSRFLDR
jgi:hypothetical protein